MERIDHVGRIAVPVFALAWLALIFASMLCDVYVPGIRYGSEIGNQWRVTSESPAAFRAGVRPGMVLDISELSFSQRMLVYEGGMKGTLVAVPLHDGAAVTTFTLPAELLSTSDLNAKILEGVLATFCLLLATYLGYRKPGFMIVSLIVFLGGGLFDWPTLIPMLVEAPLWFSGIVLRVFDVLCDVFPVLVLASFAIRVPGDEPSPKKRRAIRIVDGVVAAGFFLDFLIPTRSLGGIVYESLAAIVLVVASVLSLYYARPQDRARVGIVFAGIILGGLGYAVGQIATVIGGGFPWYFFTLTNISIAVIPLAMTYAIVRHRVFDIGFVLNRTIVYGVTSLLVLLVFASVEFVAERYLTQLTHAESVAVDFGIALVVIVGARYVHRRVDRLVDGLLFRTRHEQESALRRFSSTAQYYTARGPLVRDTIDAIVRFGRVRHAAMYLAEDAEFAAAGSTFASLAERIEENDAVFVEMRAHHEPIDTAHSTTALPGMRSYPLALAGRLVGVLSTGDREGGETMPPDIDDAIRRVCTSVASALAAIETDQIRRQYATLQQRFDALTTR